MTTQALSGLSDNASRPLISSIHLRLVQDDVAFQDVKQVTCTILRKAALESPRLAFPSEQPITSAQEEDNWKNPRSLQSRTWHSSLHTAVWPVPQAPTSGQLSASGSRFRATVATVITGQKCCQSASLVSPMIRRGIGTTGFSWRLIFTDRKKYRLLRIPLLHRIPILPHGRLLSVFSRRSL